MVAKTEEGGGTEDASADQRYYDISVLDAYSGEIACVRVESYDYVEYLHLACSEGVWLIVNVLWAYNHIQRTGESHAGSL